MSSPAQFLSSNLYSLRRWSRKVWVRSALIAGLGIVAAVGSGQLAPLVPDQIAKAVKPEAVEKILQIVATGMLSVVIFSLSVMVSARQSASTQGTPRSHQLLLEDTTTQNVLATFLGAFLFSLVGVITLGTQLYQGDAAAVILAFTLLVIGLIVVAILRWISHLSDLGSVVETTRTVETAASRAMTVWVENPCMGGTPLHGDPLGPPVLCRRTGYVQHVDIPHLSKLAEDGDFEIYLAACPGSFLTEGQILAHLTGICDLDQVHEAFTVGDSREFDQDPRFGIIVLSEVAQRALSPGINDPGTAIDVLTRQHKLLARFRDRTEPGAERLYPRIHVAPLSSGALMEDAFDPIARDGAAIVELQIRLQKVLADLGRNRDTEFGVAARACARRSKDRAMQALTLEDDRSRLQDVINELAD